MVSKVACYITGGWTECGAMQSFLKKINSRLDYQQRCPHKPKYQKRNASLPIPLTEIRGGHSGLTGSDLVKYLKRDLRKYADTLRTYCAILLEDDRDKRSPEVLDSEKIQLQREIKDTLGKDIPLIVFWASPEIEAWFLADWEHSFGRHYGPEGQGLLSSNNNYYFSCCFKKYVHKNVLQQFTNCIEDYGFFDNEYIKLSNALIQALEYDFPQILSVMEKTEAISAICECYTRRVLRYSKKIDGDAMLRALTPEKVAQHCITYFKPAMLALKNLNSDIQEQI